MSRLMNERISFVNCIKTDFWITKRFIFHVWINVASFTGFLNSNFPFLPLLRKAIFVLLSGNSSALRSLYDISSAFTRMATNVNARVYFTKCSQFYFHFISWNDVWNNKKITVKSLNLCNVYLNTLYIFNTCIYVTYASTFLR